MARAVTGPGPARRGLAALASGALLLSGVALLTEAGPAVAAPLNRCVDPDNGVPVVEQVSFSPASVDVTSSPQQVTLRVRVVDPGGPGPASGIAHLAGVVAPAGSGYYQQVELVKGADGWWSAGLTVPRHAAEGAWWVRYLTVVDRAGNSAMPRLQSAWDNHLPPFDQPLTVTSAPDMQPPVVIGVAIGPDQVDTRRRPKRVGIAVTASDDLSGVAGVSVRAVRGRHVVRADLTRDGGAFTGGLRIPRWRGTGTWNVEVSVEDRVGNTAVYKKDRLAAVGERSFEVVGRADGTDPVLLSTRLDPERIDIRQQARTVTFTVRLADGRSGVRSARIHLYATDDGDPEAPMTLVPLTRTRGTAQRGTWVGKIRIAPCTFIHRRAAIFVEARDRADNDHLWLPVRLRVRSLDLWPPRAEVPRPHVGASGPVTLTFDEAVNGIGAGSPAVREYHPDLQAYGPPLAGTWTCVTGSGAPTSCATGAVRRASWTPDAPLDVPASYRLELDPEGNLDVTDLHGNPFRRVRCFSSTEADVPSEQRPAVCYSEDEELY